MPLQVYNIIECPVRPHRVPLNIQFVRIAFDEHQIECEILNIKFPKYKICFDECMHTLTHFGWHEMEIFRMPNSVWNFNVWLPVNLIHVYPHFCFSFSLSLNIWLLASDFQYNHLQRRHRRRRRRRRRTKEKMMTRPAIMR